MFLTKNKANIDPITENKLSIANIVATYSAPSDNLCFTRFKAKGNGIPAKKEIGTRKNNEIKILPVILKNTNCVRIFSKETR